MTAPESLRVMWFVPPPVVAVAAALGMVEKHTFSGMRNSSSDEQFEALSTGRVDLVVTAMDNVIAWNRRPGPADFRVVAQIEQTTPLHIFGRPGTPALADVRGAVVLVDAPDNGFVIALQALLAEAGLGANSYTLRPAGGVKERFDALLAGEGACTLLGPPFDTMALKAGMVRLASVQERWPAFPGQGLVMRTGAMARLGAQVRAWLQGLELAARRMAEAQADGEVRQALVAAGFPEATVPMLVALRPRTLRPDRDGVELIVSHRRQLGLPGGDDTYDALVDPSLLHPSAGAHP